MTVLASSFIEKLKRLSHSQLAEVESFVDFLLAQEQRALAEQYLTDALNKLDALKLPTLSEDEVEQEVRAARQNKKQ